MPMKSSGDLVGFLDIFSVNKCHAFNDLGEVFEAAYVDLHRNLTHLRIPRSLKKLLFALLETGHFHIAKAGSIQRANQQ